MTRTWLDDTILHLHVRLYQGFRVLNPLSCLPDKLGILGAVYCLVKTPHLVGGSNEYLVDAASLSDAVRRALEINEHFVGRRSDDTIVTLIEDG